MPSVGAQLDHARNRAALSPSFKEGGVSIMANPTDMPQYGGAEEEDEEKMSAGGETGGGYGYSAFAGDEEGDDTDESGDTEEDDQDEDDSADEQSRGILQAAGAQALASSAAKKLDPMDNVKFVTLDWWIWILFTPSGWVSYLKVDSYINPTEATLRLTILKVTFWVVLVLGIAFLTVVIVLATAEMNPAFRILKFWAGIFLD